MNRDQMDVATAALDQPGDEGEAYGKAKADWQPRSGRSVRAANREPLSGTLARPGRVPRCWGPRFHVPLPEPSVHHAVRRSLWPGLAALTLIAATTPGQAAGAF